MKRKFIFAGRVAAVLAVLTAPALPVTAQAWDLQNLPQFSGQRAREIAVEFLGHGAARDIMLFTENDVPVFEVEVRNANVRYMVYINAANGSVVRMSRHEDGYVGITTLPEIVPPVPVSPTRPVPPWQPPASVPPATHSSFRLDEAGRTAVSRNGGGLIRHICLDWERGVAVYHVRLYHNGNRVDYYLDRSTLETVRHRTRQHNNASSGSSSFQRRQMNTAPSITWNRAAEIALAHLGGRLDEISRDYTWGGPAFEVEVIRTNGEEWEVYVDIHTGAILRYHRDN